MKILNRLGVRYPKLFGYLMLQYPLREILDPVKRNEDSSELIPNTVYQTWEIRNLGKSHFQARDRFVNLNPEYDFIFFDRFLRDQYMHDNWNRHPIYKIYKDALFGPLATDIFRYCLIFDKGGIYVDINKGLSTPINNFKCPETNYFFSYEVDLHQKSPDKYLLSVLRCPNNFILNWAFGFRREHPVLLSVVNKIVENEKLYRDIIFARPSQAVVNYTGTTIFTEVLHDYVLNHREEKFNDSEINFDGKGITALKYSWVRYAEAPPYSKVKNQPILMESSA